MQRSTTAMKSQITGQTKHSPRRRTIEPELESESIVGTTIAYHLPVYDPNSGIGKKEMSSSKSMLQKEKLVHLIPLVLFLCIFVLWFFSYSAMNLEIKDGKITVIEMPPLANNTRVDLTILALGTPLNAPVPDQTPTSNNGIAPEPASEID